MLDVLPSQCYPLPPTATKETQSLSKLLKQSDVVDNGTSMTRGWPFVVREGPTRRPCAKTENYTALRAHSSRATQERSRVSRLNTGLLTRLSNLYPTILAVLVGPETPTRHGRGWRRRRQCWGVVLTVMKSPNPPFSSVYQHFWSILRDYGSRNQFFRSIEK